MGDIYDHKAQQWGTTWKINMENEMGTGLI